METQHTKNIDDLLAGRMHGVCALVIVRWRLFNLRGGLCRTSRWTAQLVLVVKRVDEVNVRHCFGAARRAGATGGRVTVRTVEASRGKRRVAFKVEAANDCACRSGEHHLPPPRPLHPKHIDAAIPEGKANIDQATATYAASDASLRRLVLATQYARFKSSYNAPVQTGIKAFPLWTGAIHLHPPCP